MIDTVNLPACIILKKHSHPDVISMQRIVVDAKTREFHERYIRLKRLFGSAPSTTRKNFHINLLYALPFLLLGIESIICKLLVKKKNVDTQIRILVFLVMFIKHLVLYRDYCVANLVQ